MKRNLIKAMLITASLSTGIWTTNVQANPTVGADVVSAYFWRGTMLNNGLNIQPSITLSTPGERFSLGIWGNTGISKPFTEIDLFASAQLGNFNFTLTDYFVYSTEVESEMTNFFDYKNLSTGHTIEASLAVTVSEKIPITFAWNTFIYGFDYDANEQQYFSTYMEASYDFEVKDTQVTLFAGATPWAGLYASKAALVNTGFSVSQEINITPSFSIPLSATFSINPYLENAWLIIGFTI